MTIDLCSITQNGKRSFSFFSQCAGLLAEIGLGTESWRWMGDTRFIIGFFRQIIANKSCPVKLSIKVVASDKEQMVAEMEASRKASTNQTFIPDIVENGVIPSSDGEATPYPPVQFAENDEEGWITFDKPVCSIYAGKMPYMGRDLLSHPCAQPSDGLVDVVAQGTASRGKMLSLLNGSKVGKQFWLETVHYFKASAYRISPLNQEDKGYVSIDGEGYPFAPFQVEVHRGIATTLSPHGHYIHEFAT